MYRNYIFDLYGTLVDIHTDEEKVSLWKNMAGYYSLQGAAYTARELKQEYALLVDAEVKRQVRKQRKSDEEIEILLDKIFARLYRQKGRRINKELVQNTGVLFRSLSLEKLKLYDGTAELLCRLREEGKKVYLLSNAQRIFTEPEMRVLGIYDKFDGILYSSDAGFKKPSLHFFDLLFQKYGLKKEESVMIGNDSKADIGGAVSYGIDSLYIHTEQSPAREKLPLNCLEIYNIAEVGKERMYL